MPGHLFTLRLFLHSPAVSAFPLRRAVSLARITRSFSARADASRRGAADRFRSGSVAGKTKSLVDDEEELSNWVSDLKMDSFRSESTDRGGRSVFGANRRRGSDSDEASGSRRDGRKGQFWSERGRGKRSLFGGSDFDDSDGGNDGNYRGRGAGWRGRGSSMQGSRAMTGRRPGRNSDGDFGSFRDGRNGQFGNERGRGNRSHLDSDLDDSDDGNYRGRDAGERGWGARERGRGARGRGRGSLIRGDLPPIGRQSGRRSEGGFESSRDGRRGRPGNSRVGEKRLLLDSDLDDEDEEEEENYGGKSRFSSALRSVARGGGRGRDTGRGYEPSEVTRGHKKNADFRSVAVDEDDDEDDDEDADDDSDDDDVDVEAETDGLDDESGSDGAFRGEGDSEMEMVGDDAVEVAVKLEKRSSSEQTDSSYLSDSRFDECLLSPLSLKGVKTAGYERMTVVQKETLPVILKGKDVLAKAKTGTGKTVAFLLPAIEVVAKQPPTDRDDRKPPIIVLVICPTRELANQAAMESDKLLKFHPSIGTQCVTGGTRLALEQKRMQANPCQILVATPGRLRDHIENTAGFATRLRGVKVLVLDEADHLLDMGFRKDIEQIIAAVPKQRQTLLFSATVPEEVRQVCHIALRRDHEYINTVEEGSEETHSQVRQNFLIAPLVQQFPLLYHLLAEHIADDIDYKVLIFCTTAMVTRLVAEVLSEMKLNVREIHSRKPQSYRTRVSDEFRKSKGLILVTSDVSARGVDYPDVTLVIQLGVPSDREQYIHRLGRTGRKGKEGQGVLLLAPWEEYFLSSIKDLPISKVPSPSVDPDTTRKVEHALAYVQMKDKERAYQAWLGYYNSNRIVGRDKCRLVELASEFSRSMGLETPPSIPKLVLGKMGLRNVPGLRSS